MKVVESVSRAHINSGRHFLCATETTNHTPKTQIMVYINLSPIIIIRIIKSWVRWTGHIARMEEK
jgi:hypothetical protein